MNNLKNPSEKRRFTRVPFVSHIALTQGDEHWEGDVVDISFNGILINFSHVLVLNKDNILLSTIHFENDTSIHANLKLAHQNGHLYGFCFSEIDLDSITHLRNIISHNLGDSHACERELMSLFSYHQ
jgi:hypothetical protein